MPLKSARHAKRGRHRDSPPDCTKETFVLWPMHSAMVNAWAAHYDCSRSEAIRIMIDAAGEPDSPVAEAAAAWRLRERAAWQAEGRKAFPKEQMQVARRAKAAAAARRRRAKNKVVH